MITRTNGVVGYLKTVCYILSRNSQLFNVNEFTGGAMRPQINKCAAKVLMVAALAQIHGMAAAADDPVRGYNLGPGLRLETSLQGSLHYTDNIYWTSSSEQDAMGFIINPDMVLSYTQATGKYKLRYEGEFAEYDTTSRDDYFDHLLGLSARVQPTTKHGFGIEVEYEDGHDAFGTARTSGLLVIDDRELDQWNSLDAALSYYYGSTNRRLNWRASLLLRDVEYDTNRVDPLDPMTGTRFFDRSEDGFSLKGEYKLRPRTKAVLYYIHRDIDYDLDSSPSYDGEYDRIAVGIGWVASSKTTGEFVVGQVSRDFDDSSRSDESGFDWQGMLRWSPRSYSTIKVATGQQVREHYLLGENLTLVNFFNIGWRHDWKATVHTELGLELQNQDFKGTAREDDVVIWRGGLEVELYPRYLVGVDVKLTDRDSTLPKLDIQRNSIVFSVKATY